MHSVGKWLRRIEALTAFSALAALTGSVLWGVLTRYVTERPAVWTTELSGILFTWVVFIGAMTAYRNDEHIRVTLLLDLMPDRIRAVVERLVDLVVLVFLIYVTWLALVMMHEGATRPSPVLDIPFSWVYLAVVIAFAGMSVSQALRLFGRLARPAPQEDVL